MRLVPVAVTAATFALFAAPAGAQSVQPGDAIDGGNCTLGWAFDGADGRTFFSTAAHCVEDGAKVTIGSGAELGRVVVRGEPSDVTTDIALVEVVAGMTARVSGEMRGHEGYPSAVTREAASQDTLQMSGWGTGWEVSPTTREERQGRLMTLENGGLSYRAVLPASGGDSGGPIAHVPTTGALGLVKGVSCGLAACGMWGPTITAVEQLAAKSGLTVRLRTAGGSGTTPPPGPEQQEPPKAQSSSSGGSPSGGADASAPAARPGAAAACTDTARPTVSLTSVSLSRSGVRLRGRAADTGCGSKLARVEVSILDARGRRTLRSRTSGARIALTRRVRLRRGRYTVVVRVVDTAGNAAQVRRTARVR